MARKTEIILALDMPEADAALSLVDTLKGRLSWVKVGLELFVQNGPQLLEMLAERNLRIFLDLKLHDIPNTVAKAISGLQGRSIDLLSVHTSGGSTMLKAAAEAAGEHLPSTKILGVTLLTSLDAESCKQIGFGRSPESQVLQLARLAVQSGLTGLVCSPLELQKLRAELGASIVLVSPGIRAASNSGDDQKRSLSCKAAAAAGADYLVVGRPITQAPCALSVLEDLLRELET